MKLRLRQVALVATKLATAEREITDTLGVDLCFRDPNVAEFGLHNALFPLGDTFLEVVSPTVEGTTAGRLLDKRGGDGGYMVLLQTDDLAAFRARVDRLGVRVVHVAQGRTICGLHLHPRDVGGAILSVDHSDPAEDWEWAGPHWREHIRATTVGGIEVVEIQVTDPAASAARWGEILDRSPAEDAATVPLDAGCIRFVREEDGRGEGVGGIDVRATDRSRAGEVAMVSGTRVRFL